ncbi:hypothetical protein BDR26DRAFT_887074 [Obelidium mucronatum]|nr:hypothetical protein BDR26DRAFT_887074 [Obelidium mucronatum]
MNRDIWYLLVDGKGDPAFEDVGAYFVSFSTEETVHVADFVEKVWLQNKNKLRDVDEPDLKVFSNKEDITDETKAFKASALVGDRGENEDVPLLVRVLNKKTAPYYSAVDVDVQPFDPNRPSNNIFYPFFDRVVEKYLTRFGDTALFGRDSEIQKANAIISSRLGDKFRPIICSTSRGMGKTAFLGAIGMQAVKPSLKLDLMSKSRAYGRILSFDFSGGGACFTKEEIESFFPRLMIYFLCRLFAGSLVDGMVFQEIEFSNIANPGKDAKFNAWKKEKLTFHASRMITEYIRLTNLAYGVQSEAPLVFLLDEIQILTGPTNIPSKFDPLQEKDLYHSSLSYLLTQLEHDKPVCICTGTNSGNILILTEKSKLLPEFIHLSALRTEKDSYAFWKQRTAFHNTEVEEPVTVAIEDIEQIRSLVYASCQVPRLMVLAHEVWFRFKLSPVNDRMLVFESFLELSAAYYGEIFELILSTKFQVNDLAHILMACGVHWKVEDVNGCVPGTNICWAMLIQQSVVFPFFDNCYIIPFHLLWSANSQSGDYTMKKREIEDHCKTLIPGLYLPDLFVSYDQVRKLDLYNQGILYETIFVSSLAVKYHLLQKTKGCNAFRLSDVYECGSHETKQSTVFSTVEVDFSCGISLPEQETFVSSNIKERKPEDHACLSILLVVVRRHSVCLQQQSLHPNFKLQKQTVMKLIY